MRRSTFLKRAVGVIIAPSILAKMPLPAAQRAAASRTTILPMVRDANVGDIIRVVSSGEALRVTSVDQQSRVMHVMRGIGSVAPHPVKGEDDMLVVSRPWPGGVTFWRDDDIDDEEDEWIDLYWPVGEEA